ncbi:DUF2306 domain-containing protein [Flavobacteriaceae bacterium TP-CH-4]|uniref:DUF2306 domain-containing protein n=1 Tax=Pelagihabitans pacificus TaxID=2696054 RepID=A0A967ARI8_9FLAO|nr:DUF2306 domain-containing protein [Pelagihabitans pacificus]NHF58175.1 DUF2306 domain-containing protein [Pelagihabitans pacificus]
MNTTNKVAWFVFAVLAICIGLYPTMYLFIDRDIGLLASKSDALLANPAWNIGFYGHIFFGGLALLVGWSQFSKRWRNSYLQAHRTIGKIYVVAALISGICGIFIAFYATGGIISMLGFLCLGVFWVFTTGKAYLAIRKGDISLHQGFMIYSYAACFAAVTLRIWLPLLTIALSDFVTAYRIVAWLCWVPNIVFAFVWIRRKGLIIG